MHSALLCLFLILLKILINHFFICQHWYDVCEFFEAWDEFIRAADTLSASEAYQYDIVDFTRQALQILADQYYNQLIRAFKKKDTHEFQ